MAQSKRLMQLLWLAFNSNLISEFKFSLHVGTFCLCDKPSTSLKMRHGTDHFEKVGDAIQPLLFIYNKTCFLMHRPKQDCWVIVLLV